MENKDGGLSYFHNETYDPNSPLNVLIQVIIPDRFYPPFAENCKWTVSYRLVPRTTPSPDSIPPHQSYTMAKDELVKWENVLVARGCVYRIRLWPLRA